MVAFPNKSPSWARTAVNLKFQPISGTTKIAYVDPLAGSDPSGQVYTYNASDGDYRYNPAVVAPFATGDAAIAAVGRDGPHAVLFANAGYGAVHTAPVVNGGCQGLSAAHPYYFGAYFPAGASATASENLALFDPGLGQAASGNVFSVQRGAGFSYLLIEGLHIRHSHRIAGDAAYDQAAALNSANHIGGIKIYGGNQSHICLRNVRVEGTTEGIRIESSVVNGLANVTLENVIVKDVWAPSGTYEGVYAHWLYRPRFINCVIMGCGHNRNDLSLGYGDTAQGRNQGIYFDACQAPWVHNSILAHNSHAGIQARCGGYVTQCVFWANARNLGFGHGQNQYENRLWQYAAVADSSLFYGARDVGAGYPNPSLTPLKFGEGIGWGRCDTGDISGNIFVGDPGYMGTDNVYGMNIGTTPGSGGTLRISANTVYEWNASGVSATGEISMQSGTTTGATLSFVGNRVKSKTGQVIYVQGTETVTRVRLENSKITACRVELTGTAALYGPTGTAPTNVSSGFRTGTVAAGDTWGGTAPTLWAAVKGGFATEAAFITEVTTPGSRWDAVRILNAIRTLPQFNYSRLPELNLTAPNQAYTGV